MSGYPISRPVGVRVHNHLIKWDRTSSILAQGTSRRVTMSTIYVASSWRNDRQPQVVDVLEKCGHTVYDFRNPHGELGFSFNDIHLYPGKYNVVTPHALMCALANPIARRGFGRDFDAMKQAELCVLVLPCERDAHLELGWFAGAGKRTAILLDSPCKPSLMYCMVDYITDNLGILLKWIQDGMLPDG